MKAGLISYEEVFANLAKNPQFMAECEALQEISDEDFLAQQAEELKALDEE